MNFVTIAQKVQYIILILLVLANNCFSASNEKNNIFHYKETDIILGNPNADVKIFEYSSPTCGYCAYYTLKIFDKIKSKYIDTNKISYVIRKPAFNKQDMSAVMLMNCVGKEKFLDLLDNVYRNQDKWILSHNYDKILTNIGESEGLSEGQYAQCLKNKKMIGEIYNITKEFMNYPGVIGTPTFFIGNKIYNNSYSFKSLSKAIDEELYKKQKTE